jgi:hypothetical protein
MRRKSGNGTLTLHFRGKKRDKNNLSLPYDRSKIMRMTLLSPLALRAVVFAALAESVALWAAEPVRLTGTQMDAVTAGAVSLGVSAWAATTGSNTYTYASTSTTASGTPTTTVVTGSGYGEALACCGSSTNTSVQTTYYAEGDRVIANSTVTDTSTPWASYSYGYTNVIAVE